MKGGGGKGKEKEKEEGRVSERLQKHGGIPVLS